MVPLERGDGRGTASVSLASPAVYRPACWLAPLQTATDALEQGYPVLLLLAPPGHGKTAFLADLAGRAAADGWRLIRLVPEGTGSILERARQVLGMTSEPLPRTASVDDLPPVPAASDPPPSLFAIDAADSLTDSTLRAVLLLPLLAPMADRTVSVVLCGGPELAKRVERLLPARQPGSLPRVSLPAWPEEDIRGFLQWRLANGVAPASVAADVPARLADLTHGRPGATAALVSRSLALAGGAAASALSRDTIEPTVAGAASGEDATFEGGPEDRALPAPRQPYRDPREGSGRARGLGRAAPALPPRVEAPPVTGAPLGRIGLFRSPAPRSLTPLFETIVPLVLGVLILVAGWALWGERTPEAPLAGSSGGSAIEGGGSSLPASDERVAVPAAGPAGPAAPPPADGVPRMVAEAPVAPAIAVPAIAGLAPVDVVGNAELIARGDALMRLSDPAAARQFYLLAARRGHAAGLTAAAATFDPLYLRARAMPGARADQRQAIDLYREAARLGDRQAAERLQALLAETKPDGGGGGAEATPLDGPPR